MTGHLMLRAMCVLSVLPEIGRRHFQFQEIWKGEGAMIDHRPRAQVPWAHYPESSRPSSKWQHLQVAATLSRGKECPFPSAHQPSSLPLSPTHAKPTRPLSYPHDGHRHRPLSEAAFICYTPEGLLLLGHSSEEPQRPQPFWV